MAIQRLPDAGLIKTGTAYIYQLVHISDTTISHADIPAEGDTLTPFAAAPADGTFEYEFNHTIPPICTQVQIDERRYPKRFLIQSTWEAPLTRAELQAGVDIA